MLILDHMVFIGNGLHMKSSNFLTDSDKWLKQIEDIKHKSFTKIRITGKPKPQSEEWETLMNAKQELRAKLKKIVDPVLKNKTEENILQIENEISKLCSEKNANIVKEHIAEMSNGSDQICRLNIWRLKKKLCPQNIDPPMAKRDKNGDLVSNPETLKQLYVDTYKDRLRHRIISTGYEDLEKQKTFLFNLRLFLSKTKKS